MKPRRNFHTISTLLLLALFNKFIFSDVSVHSSSSRFTKADNDISFLALCEHHKISSTVTFIVTLFDSIT